MLEFNGKINLTKDRISEFADNSGSLSISSETIDLNFTGGCQAYAGFVDSHGHVAGYGMRKHQPDLSNATSFEECVEIMKSTTFLRGDWLVGYGWNQENWTDKSFPDKRMLDKAFPDTAVFLLRQDGHSAIINSEAMKIAGINKSSANVEGGIIEKDEFDEPTGILIDNSINSVHQIIPDFSFEQYNSFIQAATDDLATFGITEVHDMDVETSLLPIFQDLEFQGKLPIRINAYIRAQNNEWLRDSVLAYKGNMYSIKGLKYYIDGALGSRGAALLRHYDDNSKTDGVILIDEKSLYNRAKRGIMSNFDIAFHAIGDRAARFSLDIFEKLRKDPLLRGRGGFRIEHSQIVQDEDLPRYNDNNVVASVQPLHFANDAKSMATKRIGSRLKYAYRWKSFLKQNVLLLAGSDFPVESPSVIEGIRTLIHRLPIGSDTAIHPEEKLSLSEAINSYTIAPRIATGDEIQRGKLEIGKQADITVLSKSLSNLERDYNSDIEVAATIVNGKIAYISNKFLKD